jgi:MFS family permease
MNSARPNEAAIQGIIEKRGITRNVVLTGLTSFFTDISSEMIYPLIQAFVSTIMASQRTLLGPILGIIEGIAESTASLLKVFFGYYSDRVQRRKNTAIAGYSTSALAKFLLLLASFGWHFVLLARFLDRVGKGIRTAPRDALISESTPKEMQGKGFGLHRGMDFAGATIGALICFFLVLRFMDPVTKTLKDLNAFYLLFLISIIPALIGVVVLFFVKETKARSVRETEEEPRPNLNPRHYDKNLRIFFLLQLVFTLGNSSNQFLLLRSMNLGHALSTVVLMYLTFNLSTSLLATSFGFGLISRETNFLLWYLWPLYGVHCAMTEGVEKAFVSDIAPMGSRATALGFYHTIVGLSLLPASIIAGVLFSILPSAPFLFGGVMAMSTVVILGLFVREK